jgi:hypothetical protein
VTTAATVTVDFAAETAKFRAEVDRVNKRLSSLEGSFNAVENLAKGFLAGLSIGALGAFIQSAADAADALGKTADRLDISAESLKKFQVAAEQAGVPIETANGLLRDAQKRLGEAGTGAGAAAKTIAALGLNVKDLAQLSPDVLFTTYSEAIGKLGTRSEQVAAATDLFGKAAADSLGFVLTGADAMASASTFVDRYGLALSRIDISQIEAANDGLGDLKMISQGVGQQLAVGLAPFVDAIAQSMLEATGSTTGFRDAMGMAASAGYVGLKLLANTAYVLEAAFFGVAAAVARWSQTITFGDVSAAFAAAVDANVAKMQIAMGKVQSLQAIQQGLTDLLDASRAKAEAAVAANAAATKPQGLISLAPEEFANQLSIKALQSQEMLAVDTAYADSIIAAQQNVTAALDEELAERVAITGSYDRVLIAESAATEEAQIALKQQAFDTATQLLAAFAAKSKTAAKAQVLVNKAMAIAQAIQNTAVGVTNQLKTGDPYTAIPRAIAVGAFGALQVAAIIKTGYNEVQAIDNNGGRAPIGSPTNPVFTDRPENAPGNVGSLGTPAQARGTLSVTINGNFFSGRETINYLVERLREEINDKDVVLFSGSSQQAQELAVT